MSRKATFSFWQWMPRGGDHTCDLTALSLSIFETDGDKRGWNLASDVADSILEGNPHADQHGNKGIWSFVRGPSRAVAKSTSFAVPPASLLGRWRESASVKSDAALAEKIRMLLMGARPGQENDPNRAVYDYLVSAECPLFQGLDLAKLTKARADAPKYGLPADRFTGTDLVVDANTSLEIRLPAALLRDREFVADGDFVGSADNRLAYFQASLNPQSAVWDGKSNVVTTADSPAYKKLLAGHALFRDIFPTFVCYPGVVPLDEVVTLKMYHREDEPLKRLFLDEVGTQRVDHLWAEHRFISQQPIAENKYLPQFIGFVTQDQPKELLAYFESQRPLFQKRADDLEHDMEAAIPAQLKALLDFAEKSYRRPLLAKEKTDLQTLYQTLRSKKVPHEEALRGVLARILVSPAYLFRIEAAPLGEKSGSISDWELASRLSYFLTSSMPDDELRRLATEGKLHDPNILTAQTLRLLKDERIRALAIEFGTQWLHARGFDELKEKNEHLFPSFDATLKKSIYEESIRFFQYLFQADRPATEILAADYTFVDERLANHYGIPGIQGPQFRKVDGVRKYHRGGILGLASIQAKQSGASRTSPTLRGNWVVETLLGEKLPRPPANVPQLPEQEGSAQLTQRQLVEKHANAVECAVCHVRIDPYGFAPGKFRHHRPPSPQRPVRFCYRHPTPSSRMAPNSRASMACVSIC